MADDTTSFTADDVNNFVKEGQQYAKEASDTASAYGVDVKVAGNDPKKILAATGTAAATGAGIGGAIGTAFPVIGTAIGAAVGAIVGALAGLFASLDYSGVTQEQIDLAKELDRLSSFIWSVLQTVPEPYRHQMASSMIEAMRRQPGKIPFCLGTYGCVATSMKGIRDAGAAVDGLARSWLAKAQADASAAAQNDSLTSGKRWLVGLAFAGVAVYAGAHFLAKGKRP